MVAYIPRIGQESEMGIKGLWSENVSACDDQSF